MIHHLYGMKWFVTGDEESGLTRREVMETIKENNCAWGDGGEILNKQGQKVGRITRTEKDGD